jgi:phytoene synthase
MAGQSDDPLFPAVADTVRRFAIPPDYLQAAIDGVEMDLDRSRYETWDELAGYCDRVASVVGLACLHVWGFRGDGAIPPARACGLAFQLTNILRDLQEDAARDRVYLPAEDLRRFGYSADDLLRGVCDERLAAVVRFEAARADALYDDAARLAEWLSSDGRRVFGAMFETYRALLDRVKSAGPDLLRRRVRVGRWHKMRIAARWLLFPSRRLSPAACAGEPSP